ncbi:Peroxidase 52 [Castilleja foliolosa]|uniref:Peroxidase n=1 Tax=Castilleja foliolosa TaxID=1961234 RepID=A0ABD3EGJ7_9LAMI
MGWITIRIRKVFESRVRNFIFQQAPPSFAYTSTIASLGCDGSILLDDVKGSFRGEKTARPNNNSARGFEVIDQIKTQLEKQCPKKVSCADILAFAARDSVVALGGPTWVLKFGRLDSLSASFQAADNGSIPAPTSSLSNLISRFGQLGLDSKDLVALSGAHTIGIARCTSFRARIYNDKNINSTFAKERQGNCPKQSGSGDNNIAPLDSITPTKFDNNYFSKLAGRNGLLHSDQELFNGGGSTDTFVQSYINDQNAFNIDFANAMIKMGKIGLLTRNKGEIRTNCRVPNNK